jgi:hypothetical protein
LETLDQFKQSVRSKFGQQQPQRKPDEPAHKFRSLGSVLTLTALAGLAAGGAWLLVDKTSNAPVLGSASTPVRSAPATSTATAWTRTAPPDGSLDLKSLVKDAAIRIDAPVPQAALSPEKRSQASGADPAATLQPPASDQPRAAAKDLASETAPSPLPSATVKEAFQNAIPKVSPPAAQEVASLMERSSALIRAGNIAGARRVLERAASVRSAEALLRLAKTYDPVVLAHWRALGVKADPEKARELYRQAAELGASEAPETTTSLAQAAPTGSRR